MGLSAFSPLTHPSQYILSPVSSVWLAAILGDAIHRLDVLSRGTEML